METTNKEEYWSQYAEVFEKNQEFVVGNELIQIIKDKLSFEYDLQDTLELGCGTALFTEVFSKNANQVIASDFSNEMIAKAKFLKKHLKNTNLTIEDAMNP